MDRSVHFGSEEQVQRVLGINDRNLPYLEALLGGDLYVKGNTLTIRSADETAINRFTLLFNRLDRLAATQPYFSEAEIFLEFQAVKNDRPISELVREERARAVHVVHNHRVPQARGRRRTSPAWPFTDRLGIGPAGTERPSSPSPMR